MSGDAVSSPSSSGGVSSSVEFSVNLTCQSCVGKVNSVLRDRQGVDSFRVDLEAQSVVVRTSLPTADVQAILESTGKSAVVVGVGREGTDGRLEARRHLGAAVAAIGGPLGAGADPDRVRGVVRFVQLDTDRCLVDGAIDGLVPGAEHALAVHESGDLSNGCASVGGHFNPRGVRHGSPDCGADGRHAGDLGNIRADSSGRATFRFADDLIKVWDIVGRSVVVAAGRDDLGEGGHPRSEVDGNCGAALSCGIIARSAGLFQNSSKKFCACDGVTIWDEKNVPSAGDGRALGGGAHKA